MPTGIRGVFYKETHGAKPWWIQKTIDKKRKTFYFATKDEAVQARKEDLDAKDSVKRQKIKERQALRPKRWRLTGSGNARPSPNHTARRTSRTGTIRPVRAS